MATSTITKHYTRLLTLWPKDLLRPDQPFTRVLEARLPKPAQPSPQSTTTSSSPPSPSAPKTPTTTATTPQQDLPQLNALYSLLENRYSTKYPLSAGVLRPTSNPGHYEALVAEIERAPTKSWWAAKLDEWKGKIRLS